MSDYDHFPKLDLDGGDGFPSRWKAGDRVLAVNSDGWYYPGVIAQTEIDECYIEFDDAGDA